MKPHVRILLATRLVGSSPALRRVLELIHQVAPSQATVLITGESGTGKELAAATIHALSSRAAGPFVKVHCAALVETLLESELFGHERGAFTGAIGRRDGRFQQADGGTLFLDEIGEISPGTQVKLLRFLQHHELERVGGNESLRVDVRVIVATNRALGDDVKQGRFREDLYYRLNVVPIEMPPLRARRDDIPALAQCFVERAARANERAVTRLSAGALEQLLSYPWPGNVRELENVIERAVVLCPGEEIRPSDLPPLSAGPRRGAMPEIPGSSLAEVERYLILRTLEHTGGCRARAARLLGISPRTLSYRLREYRSEVTAAKG